MAALLAGGRRSCTRSRLFMLHHVVLPLQALCCWGMPGVLPCSGSGCTAAACSTWPWLLVSVPVKSPSYATSQRRLHRGRCHIWCFTWCNNAA
jgi:hypothetical protein